MLFISLVIRSGIALSILYGGTGVFFVDFRQKIGGRVIEAHSFSAQASQPPCSGRGAIWRSRSGAVDADDL